MAEPIWIREYAESKGAIVEWNDSTKEVIIDGSAIKPEYIKDGKAYIDKGTIDKLLSEKGYIREDITPSEVVGVRAYAESFNAIVTWDSVTRKVFVDSVEIPWSYITDGTAYVDKAILDARLQNAGRMETVLTYQQLVELTPAQLQDIASRSLTDKIRVWVVETILQPVMGLFDSIVIGFKSVVTTLVDLPGSVYGFLQSLSVGFDAVWEKGKAYATEIGTSIRNDLLALVLPPIQWIESIQASANYILIEKFNHLVYLVDTGFEQLQEFLTNPISYVAALVGAGFELFVEEIGVKLEHYIDENWERDIYQQNNHYN